MWFADSLFGLKMRSSQKPFFNADDSEPDFSVWHLLMFHSRCAFYDDALCDPRKTRSKVSKLTLLWKTNSTSNQLPFSSTQSLCRVNVFLGKWLHNTESCWRCSSLQPKRKSNLEVCFNLFIFKSPQIGDGHGPVLGRLCNLSFCHACSFKSTMPSGVNFFLCVILT